ncbi:MAG TPA: hypothetical protein VFJ05_05420 [Nitrososphaeraceae archaeon]|nr:hypothetical protein [Nitrososphaeraceae archaeon]
MVGTFAMSAGVLLSGFPKILEYQYGLDHIYSIKLLFSFYSTLGLGVLRTKKLYGYGITLPVIRVSVKPFEENERKEIFLRSIEALKN